ncbi:MAG: MlaE family ABC transporter permease [Desulfurella sp.]|uniref:MlaE family ABC transporter permease n=1 Tax=Desulfurella sp. TaxID=1962857 RepID=UPI003CAEF4DD
MFIFTFLGSLIVNFIDQLGGVVILAVNAILNVFKGSLRLKQTIDQFYAIGVTSSFIVILTSLFIGMVEALQIYHGFQKFGAENMIGYTVAVSLGRELSPVFTALMIVARNISAMSAEIGTMKITEQIDAMEVMAVDPINYIVTPRIVATVVMLPFLVALSNVVGNIGGYVVGVFILKVSSVSYIDNIKQYLELSDLTYGFIKAAIFGLIISSIGCYMGFNTTKGAKGVGLSTTKAVVVSSVAILVADYILSAFLF